MALYHCLIEFVLMISPDQMCAVVELILVAAPDGNKDLQLVSALCVSTFPALAITLREVKERVRWIHFLMHPHFGDFIYFFSSLAHLKFSEEERGGGGGGRINTGYSAETELFL